MSAGTRFRSRAAIALALCGGLLVVGESAACVLREPKALSAHANITNIRPNLFEAYVSVFYDGCTARALDGEFFFDIPELRYVSTKRWNGRDHRMYETAPDSALMIFTVGNDMLDIESTLNPGQTSYHTINRSPSGSMGVKITVYSFSRGGGMRSFEAFNGLVRIHFPAAPQLDTEVPVDFSINFPATTCPLKDANEQLQDVLASDLPTPGSTAHEKTVAIRMECGADAPRARLSLSDANDASNVGSVLAPAAGSDAQGVRIQLLRHGSEVQFGQRWLIDPGVGGTQDQAFTARYLRTNDPLLPGVIKGEAVLDVDYW